ncbi:MAG: hypothetical protein ACFFCS_05225 [Candidatus Hodarchaeota archaeon]
MFNRFASFIIRVMMNGKDNRDVADGKPVKGKRLTGNALLARVQGFLDENRDLVNQLKVTSEGSRGRIRVHVIRCIAMERFLDLLADKMIAAHWQNQHDVASVFLNMKLKGGRLGGIKQRNVEGTEIDVTLVDIATELKTKSGIDVDEIPAYINQYFDEMVDRQGEKQAWWFVYMLKRADAKGNIGSTCLYYMFVIEVDTVDLDDCDLDGLIKDVVYMVQKVRKRVSKEDEMRESGFATVDNVWMVDRLREENVGLKEENVELKRRITELERQLCDSNGKNG